MENVFENLGFWCNLYKWHYERGKKEGWWNWLQKSEVFFFFVFAIFLILRHFKKFWTNKNWNFCRDFIPVHKLKGILGVGQDDETFKKTIKELTEENIIVNEEFNYKMFAQKLIVERGMMKYTSNWTFFCLFSLCTVCF